MIPFIKVVGAAAEEGRSLDEIVALANKFNEGIATLSVALKIATHPQNGGEIGALADDEMEIGMGQHGEGGGGRSKMLTANETADIMAQALIDDLKLTEGEKVLLIINGSGMTTHMEMLIVFRRAHQYLAEKGITVVGGMATEILTVQETAGFQMFMARMDDELLELWQDPCSTPYLSRR